MASVTLSGYDVVKPSSAPQVGAGDFSGDLTPAATYGYVVTFVTGFGETEPSAADSAAASAFGSMGMSNIPRSANPHVYARKIYRTVANGAVYFLLATLDDNETEQYSDTTADGDLGAQVSLVNSAYSIQNLEGTLKLSRPYIGSIERAITAGVGGTSVAAYQLTKEFNWVGTVASANDSIKLPASRTNLIGQHIVIRNNGANTLRIYPFDGLTVNAGAADAPITLAAATSIQLVVDLATNWQVI